MVVGNLISPSTPGRVRPRLLAALVGIVVAIPLAATGGEAIGHAQPGCAPAPVGDDFDGPAGTPPNPQLWNFQLAADGPRGQRWAYTNLPRNASLDGNGNLAITAQRENIPVAGDLTSVQQCPAAYRRPPGRVLRQSDGTHQVSGRAAGPAAHLLSVGVGLRDRGLAAVR